MKVLNCKQMREIEQRAVDDGTSYLELMENAGSAAARFLLKKANVSGKNIAVLCGKGNNGGDGFVVARRLTEYGARVAVILVQGLPGTEIAREMISRLRSLPVRTISYADDPELSHVLIRSADYIFDGVYGIGFHGSAPETLEGIFNALDQASGMVIALDLPSGAHGDTGIVQGRCVKADYTVTFTAMKPSHLLEPAKSYCGQVIVVPVGIPSRLLEKIPSAFEVLEKSFLCPLFRPRRADANKGSFGTLLALCGSRGMAGAASMSVQAAMRCGVGLVNLALPESIYPVAAARLSEPVFTLLEEGQDSFSINMEKLEKALKKATACLVGCGLGTESQQETLLLELLQRLRIPTVIDADGINILAEHIDELKTVKAPLVLTPHPGEMARLLKTTVADVQSNRLNYAKEFAEEYGVVLVLKGAGTLIAAPDGSLFLNPTGNPGMAVGGSGDVLAGMIASFLAQGEAPAFASACGVYLHGMAGDRCAVRLSQRAMLPTDLIGELPELFLQFERPSDFGG